jgi:hypothetical protein
MGLTKPGRRDEIFFGCRTKGLDQAASAARQAARDDRRVICMIVHVLKDRMSLKDWMSMAGGQAKSILCPIIAADRLPSR